MVLAILCTAIQAGYSQSADPWSATLYYGPSTTKWVGAVLQTGLGANGTMTGLAVDRHLLDLGDDISLGAEAQLTEYFPSPNTTVAAGLGIRFGDIFGLKGVDFSFYSGPSYASDPPATSVGYRGIVYPAWQDKFLNYVSMQLAVPLSATGKWDGVLQVYHRSGAFGLYSNSDDDGLAVGIGMRKNF